MSDDARVSLQAAYLLHYKVHRDTSFIVDMFTLEHGCVSMLARGGRSAKPATRALYQPFRPLLISWLGQRELRTLIGIEESGKPLELTGAALACAYYLNELVLRLVGKDQAQPTVFAHYALTLAELAQLREPAGSGSSLVLASAEPILRGFELQLLEALGLLPDLEFCLQSGAPVDSEQQYHFFPELAFAIPAAEPDEVLPGYMKQAEPQAQAEVLPDGVTLDHGVPVSGRTLLALKHLQLDDADVLHEAKRLMRQLLRVHLGGRPLNSRSLFDALVPPPPTSRTLDTTPGSDHAPGTADGEGEVAPGSEASHDGH